MFGIALRLDVVLEAGQPAITAGLTACEGVATAVQATRGTPVTPTLYRECIMTLEAAARGLRSPPWTRVPPQWTDATPAMQEFYALVHAFEEDSLAAGLGFTEYRVAHSPVKSSAMLAALAALRPSSHVCDVGFTAPYESLLALVANPNISVTAFHYDEGACWPCVSRTFCT